MTTPGAVRTKLWRTANRTRYNEYMAKYMQKKRQKQNEQKISEEPQEVQTQPSESQPPA